jgi:hypothetical protein
MSSRPSERHGPRRKRSSLRSERYGQRWRRSSLPSTLLGPPSRARARRPKPRSKRSARSSSARVATSGSWAPSWSAPRPVRASSSSASASWRLPTSAPRQRGSRWQSYEKRSIERASRARGWRGSSATS